MAKHLQAKLNRGTAVATPVPQQAAMPEFTFAQQMGKKCMDEIETDLVLITVLSGMEVPRDLRAQCSSTGELIKTAIKTSGFEGKRGEKLLVETDLPTTASQHGRQVLVAGLGRRDKFCGRTAYDVFEQLIQEAIRLGVKRVTIPFTPNRGTGSCLTMKGMGHKLKAAVHHCFKNFDGPVQLKEVQIYCTPQAKPHIEKGLAISFDDCPCHD